MRNMSNADWLDSKQLLDVVLSHTPVLAAYLDVDANFVWVNPAFAETCKHASDFFSGKSLFDLYPNPENRAIFQRVVDTGEGVAIKAHPFVFPDQPERGITYWDLSLVPVHDGGTKLMGVVFTLLEVTSRIAAEQDLQKSESRYRILVELAVDGILMGSHEGLIIEANQCMCELSGMRREDLIGRSIRDMPFTRESMARKPFRFDLLQAGRIVVSERTLVRPDGAEVVIEMRTKMMPDGTYQAIFRDVSERKRAEAALLEAEWKFRALFEQGPIGVAYHEMIYDASGKPFDYRFVDANDSYRKLTGVDPRGKTVRQAFPGIENDPFDWIGTFDRVVRTGESIRFEQYLQLNGRWYDCVAYRYKPDHFVVAFLEITERKKALERLRQTADELARSNKDLEQFAYIASHDLKEPLRMVTGFVSLLKERFQGQLNSADAEYFTLAEEGGLRMQRLVDDLLTYSRVGQNIRMERVDSGAALEGALENLRASIAESGAVITLDPLPVVTASSLDVLQVFQNLIGNAIKFRRVDRRPEIHVSARREGEDWLFKVTDNGLGIPPEQREKIFRIFERLHPADRYPGTGIGLAICKKIVERLGGKMWVEAPEGDGSAFCFTIPA